MTLFLNDIESHKKENKIYKSLLYIFSDEVLRDFQECISEMYEEPTSLWTFDNRGGIKQLKPRKSNAFYPEFCEYLHKCTHIQGKSAFCYKKDRNEILNLLIDYSKSKRSKKWVILKCHVGLSRLVFPLIIDEKIVGALTLGKFKSKLSDNNQIRNNVRKLFKSQNSSFLNNEHKNAPNVAEDCLIKKIKKIKKFNKSEVEKKATYIANLIPFLKAQYAKFQPSTEKRGHFIDGFVFLEDLDKELSDIFLTYDGLWKVVYTSLLNLVKNFDLETSYAYYTDNDDYQMLSLKCKSNDSNKIPAELSLSSFNDLNWLINKQRGIIFPTKDGPLIWLNDYINIFTSSNQAIIYADNIFHQKNILIVFGFKENVYLTDFEKIMLRISVNKIIRFIRNVIAKIENDEIMVSTGHKLRRTHGNIHGSINSLTKYGVKEADAKNDNQKEIITRSIKGLRNSLMQLDLITRNFHAFSDLSWIPQKSDANKKDGIDKIDLFKLLKNFKNFYDVELESEQKVIKYLFNTENLILYNNIVAVKLLFWNLIDNAIKFAYKNTYIEVCANLIDKFYQIDINNRGVGIPSDETVKVFSKYYKSTYKNRSKEISGQGIGLSICKRCMDRFFPGGKISLSSREAKIRYGEKRFDGDNYITCARVQIPVESNLYNQFLFRSQR